MSKGKAKIDQWCREIVNGIPVLTGIVTGHEDQKFLKKRHTTSRLITLDRENNIAETQNTIYTLLKELKQRPKDS